MKFYGGLSWVAIVVLVVGFVGCGPGGPATGTVKGNVQFGEKPYGDASLIFLSMQTGQGGSTNINSDGSFALKDRLPVGSYKVYLAPKIEESNLAEPKPVRIDSSVPSKYWDESTSDLGIEVAEGPNTVTIVMEK